MKIDKLLKVITKTLQRLKKVKFSNFSNFTRNFSKNVICVILPSLEIKIESPHRKTWDGS